jgi:glycosyltransferase involved in cell wall biosynthesis
VRDNLYQQTCVPDVAVVVPVYNRVTLLPRAVESLLNQKGDVALEIIIVDDGSTDGSADAVRDLDARVHIVTQPNRGIAAARRAGIEAAKAPWVTFLDSDDVAAPRKVVALWSALREGAQAGAVAAFASADLIGGGPLLEAKFPRGVLTPKSLMEDPLECLLRYGGFIPSMNILTTVELALKCARMNFGGAAEDYDFALRLARFGPFVFVDENLIHCERQADGETNANGHRLVASSIIAAEEAVKWSGRGDLAVNAARTARMDECWASALVQVTLRGDWALAARVLWIGLRRASWPANIRTLYWAIDWYLRRRSKPTS